MQISKTKVNRPPVMLIYGDHKIGKSTFAAGCPKPVFLPTEDGIQTLGVDAFPLCKKFSEVIAHIKELQTEDHAYQTLVLDSLDWTERLIWKDLCDRNNWEQIGDGAYGAGYKLAINAWRELIESLVELNQKRKMLIVLISHAKIQKFEDPERASYDRYDLDLHEKSGNLICQYVDIIGFAAMKVVVTEKQDGLKKVAKAKDTNERVLHLSKHAAFEAGNRYGLPEELPLEWAALSTELKNSMAPKPEGNLNIEVKEKSKKKKEIEIAKATIENHITSGN